MNGIGRIVALIIISVALALSVGPTYASTWIFTGSGGDHTGVIQSMINRMVSGDTLVLRGSSKVSTIALWGKSNVTIRIEGSLESVFSSEPAGKPYAGPSGNPVIGIFDGNNITITGSYIKNTYNEAIVAFSVSNLNLSCDIYGAGVGQYQGMYINGCSGVAIADCEIQNVSVKPQSALYNGGEGVAFYAVDGGSVTNCRIHDNGSNGVYLYSGTDVSVSGNYIYSNGMSGIQFNFNTGIDSTAHFTIENNYIYLNRADGIDLNNNLGTAYDVWGVVQGNYLYRNGWNGDQATPDGSGVATCVYLNQVQLSNNISIDSCRSGIYFTHCSNSIASGNVVSKRSNSLGYGAYDEYGNNVTLDSNDIYWYSGDETLKSWYVTNVAWKNNYKNAGLFVYPGYYSWPHTPPSGMTITNTPKSASNYYRYSTSSSEDFAVRFGVPSPGYSGRIVCWTNNGSSHNIQLPLVGTVKVQSMGGDETYVASVDGQVTINLTPSPIIIDVPINLVASVSTISMNSPTVSLSWTDISSTASGYTVLRATDPGFTTSLKTVSVGADARSFTDTTVAPRTTYYYKVRAANASDSLACSNTVQVTTPVVLPANPNYTPVKISGTVVLDDCTADRSIVAVRIDIDKNCAPFDTRYMLLGADGSFSVSGLTYGVYDVSIKAYASLRKTIFGIGINGVDVNIGQVRLINGDLDGDNEVTSTDLSILGLSLGLAGD